MQFYPLNASLFANASVTSSFAVSSSYIAGLVPSASHTLYPTGSKGPTGDSGGNIYLLSSTLLVCEGVTTTTTTTTSTTTLAPITTTTTTTTAAPTTTTTTTLPPTCNNVGQFCVTPEECGVGCGCTFTGEELYGRCVQLEPS